MGAVASSGIWARYNCPFFVQGFGVADFVIVIVGDEGVTAAKSTQSFAKGNVDVHRPSRLGLGKCLPKGIDPLTGGGVVLPVRDSGIAGVAGNWHIIFSE